MTGHSSHLPTQLADDHAEMLAAIGFGLSVDETASILEVDPGTIARWRQTLENTFGTPNMLEILVRMIEIGASRPSNYLDRFAGKHADIYQATLKALSIPGNELAPDERAALLEAIPRYPYIGRVWVSKQYPPNAIRIYGKARLQTPTAGSFAMVVAAAAELGQLHADQIPPPKRASVRDSIGEVDVTWRGVPGTRITGELTIGDKTYTIDFTIPGAKPGHAAGPADLPSAGSGPPCNYVSRNRA